MSDAPTDIGARLPGLSVPRGRCVPVKTPGVAAGAIAGLIDVEPDTLSHEDAEAVHFAQLEGVLDPTVDATTKPNANRSTLTENANHERRTS